MNKKIAVFLVIFIIFSCERNYTANSEKFPVVIESKIIPEEATKSDDGKINLEAKIIGIVDGDTADILYHKLQIRIRLEHIDAPEKRGKQAYGNAAKKVLSDLCFGQMVTITSTGEFDRYGRLIGEIFNEEGVNVNKEMVRLGYAWHFKKYSDDISYDKLEKEAREQRKGLWQEKNAIAPWDFR